MDHSFSYPENQNLAAVGPSQLAALEPPPPTVDFSPAEIVRHELGRWRGVHVETIQVTSHERFEYSFRHKHHLLVAIENGTRYDGELFVEGLPTSTARSCSHKLILVPAGRRFFGWQNPRQLTRSVCLYIDPATVAVHPDCRFDEIDLQARMLFEDLSLWQTIAKLKAQIGNDHPSGRLYAEALGGVLAHELLRLHGTVEPSWRACRMARETDRRVHGRASCRERLTEHARRNRAIEPVPFRAIVQTVLRGAATSLLDGQTSRPRQDLIGQSACIHHASRIGRGFQHNERI